MMISVVVRARNCAADLARCLDALRAQELAIADAIEVVVVDNDSDDGTAAVARERGALVVPLAAERFSWGRALNVGIAAARGEVVILLSADAEAADAGFVQAMLSPFTDPAVASVYGRQIPRADAPVDEIWRLQRTFDGTRRVFDAGTAAASDGRGMIVSNACAAIRRSVWEELPYDEEIEGGEEGIWTKATLGRGFRSVYEPAARAFHSHNDPVFRCAIRGVELFIKNRKLRNHRPHVLALAHWIAVNTKRRLHLCCTAQLAPRKRLAGVLRIPLDVAANLIAYATLRTAPQSRLRSALWDLRLSA